MVIQEMKKYEIDITDPREIPAACEFTEKKAVKEGISLVGLNHDHYSSIKGYSESLSGIEDELSASGYPLEMNRMDGGNTWVHSPESRCIMVASSHGTGEMNHREKMGYWGTAVEEKITEFFEKKPIYRNGDIYDEEGDQLVGASGDFTGETDLFRICLYRSDGHGERFHDIVDSEMELNGSMTDFRDRYKPLEGFYSQVMGEDYLKTEVDPVEEIFRRTGDGKSPKFCI